MTSADRSRSCRTRPSRTFKRPSAADSLNTGMTIETGGRRSSPARLLGTLVVSGGMPADDEEVPCVSGRIAHRFEHLDPRDAAERLRVPRRDAGASFNELLQACELREAERRLQVRHVVLEAESHHLVVGAPPAPVPVPGIASDPMEPQ